MKTHFTKILVALFFAITGLISCGNDDNVEEGNQPEKKAVLSIDKESLEFPEIEVNEESKLSFTISNNGNADLDITSVTIKGANKDDFTANGETETVSPNGTKLYEITLKSLIVGEKKSTVEIVTNVGTKTVSLSAIIKKGTKPIVAVEKTLLDFSEVSVNSSKDLSNLLINKGVGTLKYLEDLSFEGDDKEHFSKGWVVYEEGDPNFNPYQFYVVFSPKSAGKKTAKLKIVTNGGTIYVDLTGEGI